MRAFADDSDAFSLFLGLSLLGLGYAGVEVAFEHLDIFCGFYYTLYSRPYVVLDAAHGSVYRMLVVVAGLFEA